VALAALAGSGLAPYLLTGLAPWGACLLSAACLSIVGWGLHRAGWLGRHARRLAAFAWLPDGRWVLTHQHNETTQAVLGPQSRVSRHGVWLSWQGAAPGPLLLGRCDIPANDLRRLVVRLRIEGSRAPAVPESKAPDGVA
jgi:hypothetical protein